MKHKLRMFSFFSFEILKKNLIGKSIQERQRSCIETIKDLLIVSEFIFGAFSVPLAQWTIFQMAPCLFVCVWMCEENVSKLEWGTSENTPTIFPLYLLLLFHFRRRHKREISFFSCTINSQIYCRDILNIQRNIAWN